MKKLVLCLLISASLIACSEKNDSDSNLDLYKKNVEGAKAFISAFSSKDSTKEASLLADNLIWSGPALGQDSLPKDSLLAGDKELMRTFNDAKLTNVQFVPGVDPVTYKLDGNVRVYGTWVSKFASNGKTSKLKYYAVFGFDAAGKIISLEEYANLEDLKREF